MVWIEASAVVVSAAGVLVTAAGVTTRPARRVKELQLEADLLKALPEGEGRDRIAAHLERRAQAVADDLELRERSWLERTDRYWPLFVFGGSLYLIGVVLQNALDEGYLAVVGPLVAVVGAATVVGMAALGLLREARTCWRWLLRAGERIDARVTAFAEQNGRRRSRLPGVDG